MSDVTVHGVPGSPYMRAVLMGLEEKSVPYHLSRMTPGQSKQAPHLARHPFGRIPAFEHGDFSLYETQAILRYIDAVFPGTALRPTEPRATARMDQMIGIVDWYFFRDVSATIGFNRVVAPAFGMPTDEDGVIAAIPKAKICFAEIARLLGEKPYLACDAMTIADLMLVPHMEFISLTPEGTILFAPYPGLEAWLARMRERPSMRATTRDRLQQAV
jgi:glutathione S-transferase